MEVFTATWAILIGGLLSSSLGAAGQAGLLLRIRKKYLQEELAKCLTNFNLAGHLTHLMEAHKKQPRKAPLRTRRYFGHRPPPPPRIMVEMPHLPDVEITMRSNGSLDIHFRVLFGVYLEQSFDPFSKEVEIQLRKDFSVLFFRSSNGFSIEGCSSCPDSLDIKTLYKASNTLVDDASPLVRIALGKDLIPVLDENACPLLESALAGPASSLLSPGIFDLSPPGIHYSLKSVQIKGDNLLLELRVSDVEEEEDRNAGFSKSLPSMRKEAAADIIIMETEMDWNFGPLLCPLEPIVVDKNHHLGFCILENVQPLLPVEMSYEELEHFLVNLTIGGPARFAFKFDEAYLNHPVNIEVASIKERSNSTWTFTDVYSVPLDITVEDNKLKILMLPDSAFLHMDEDNFQAQNFVTLLQRVLEAEIPTTWLDPVRKQLPLPMVPGTVEMEADVDAKNHLVLISVIPDLDTSQNPAGE